ncbi:MAG: hypothetical protein CYPHOPRED_005636 [Cyphobasidiales sp. Tagirdzhanova-0007]|nr:MAG: hypothetical protein CYPHOPRED_005636 [Cyphobasidiales sp. Tagirdzhanova-0007]
MDELSEEDIGLLSSTSSSAWTQLPPNCEYDSRPVYIKLCCSVTSSRLVLLLTDIRSGVWYESFDELHAINIRIRVSAREPSFTRDSQSQSQAESQFSELKQEDAVSKLFAEILAYTRHTGQTAQLDIKTDSDMELVLHLPSLPFKFRLDKLPNAMSHRLLYDLFFSPLAGIVQAILTAGFIRLEEHAQMTDDAGEQSTHLGPVLLAALQRYGQAVARVPKQKRIEIKPLEEGPTLSADDGHPPQADTEIDPDQTLASTPPPQPSIPKHQASLPGESERGQGRKNRRSKDKAAETSDSSATESSEDEKNIDDKPKKPLRRQRVTTTPEDKVIPERPTSPPTSAKISPSPVPIRSISKETEAEKKERQIASTSPNLKAPVPVLKRPPPGASAGRGSPAKRGKKGLQWSNFG